MDNIQRYNLRMDSKLYQRVSDAIRSICYKLKRDEEAEPFTIFELVEALNAKGYTLSENEEEVKPYLGFMWHKDYLFLVKMHNGDCGLCKYENNEGMTIFVGRGANNGYYVKGVRLETVVELIVQIDNELPEIITKCQEQILKEEKKAKKLALSKSTIDTVVKATLKDTGIQYKLSLSSQKAILTLRLDNGLETNIHLSYKNFMDKIPYIKSTVERLNGIMSELGQPLRIKATYYRDKESWMESK